MAVTREQVVEYLSALSPDRLQDLILELEDLWGIERPVTNHVYWVTMGVGYDPWYDDDRTEWDVVLLSAGPQRITVMKLLRERFGVPLLEAKALVDSAPATICEARGRDEVEELLELLAAAGASAEAR